MFGAVRCFSGLSLGLSSREEFCVLSCSLLLRGLGVNAKTDRERETSVWDFVVVVRPMVSCN